MKKNLVFLGAALLSMMSMSCSQDQDLVGNVSNDIVAFNLSASENIAGTRAADSNVKRYAMSISGVDLDGDGPLEAGESLVQTSTQFTVKGLEKGKQYTVNFWADYDEATSTDPTYDVKWMNWVQLNKQSEDGPYKPMTMAYCGSIVITAGGQESYNVKLKRAVAQVKLLQNKTMVGNGEKISVAYQSKNYYDVNTLAPAENATAEDNTYEVTVPSEELLEGQEVGSFLVFAPKEEASLLSLTIKKDEEDLKTIDNVPLQANYQTNIKGDFISANSGSDANFMMETDAEWDKKEDTPSTPATGDYVTVGGTKWATSNAKENVTFSEAEQANLPSYEQLNALLSCKLYFGTNNGTKGVLFADESIEGLTAATLDSNAGSVTGASYDIALTADQIAKGLFLPVTSGDELFYWCNRNDATCLYVSTAWFGWKWTGAIQTASARYVKR